MMTPHILAVDDDEDALRLLEHQLGKIGYTFDALSDPKAALARAEEERYHILLTDLRMPEMDGMELIGRVSRANPEIVSIAMSSMNDAPSIIAALNEHKAYDFLPKPFTEENLKHVLDKAFEVQQLRVKALQFNESEMEVYRRVNDIFDWKSELRSLKMQSIATTVIRQLNIGFFHGGGVGGLTSMLSLFFDRVQFNEETKKYEISPKLYDMLKENYDVSLSMIRSFNNAQNILMAGEPYVSSIRLSELSPFLEGIRDYVAPMLRLKHQKISVSSLPPGFHDRTIRFDREKMKLAFIELLINAMKYSRRNDHIFVISFIRQGYLEFKVLNPAYRIEGSSDPGITGKNEVMVFEPFYRMSAVTDESYTLEEFSSGLGLSVVKKIIDLHQASIFIYNVRNHMEPEREYDVCVTIRFPLLKTSEKNSAGETVLAAPENTKHS